MCERQAGAQGADDAAHGTCGVVPRVWLLIALKQWLQLLCGQVQIGFSAESHVSNNLHKLLRVQLGFSSAQRAVSDTLVRTVQ